MAPRHQHCFNNIFLATNGNSVNSSYNKNIFSNLQLSDSNTDAFFSESQGLLLQRKGDVCSSLPRSGAAPFRQRLFLTACLLLPLQSSARVCLRSFGAKRDAQGGKGSPAETCPLAPLGRADAFPAQAVAPIGCSPGFRCLLNFGFDASCSRSE